MAIGIKHDERVRLTGQTVDLTFSDARGSKYAYTVVVENELGEGNSCICYEVTVFKDESNIGKKRILKQFYPDPKAYEIDTEINGVELVIHGFSQNESLQELGKLFEDSVRELSELSNDKKLSDIIVKPDLHYFDGATKYVLSEADYGEALNRNNIKSLEGLLEIFYDFAKALKKLHSKGIIHMDLKPENVLLTPNNKIKFFDFDSSIHIEKLSEVHFEDIRYDETWVELLAPELRLIFRDMDIGARESFEQSKFLYLNQKVDIYSFGAILFSYLLGRYPTVEECENRSYEGELFKLYNDTYRGVLTAEEQKLLNNIIWKCICVELNYKGRYTKSEVLVSDFEKLMKKINTPATEGRKTFRTVNNRLQAGYVMDKFPLSKYCRESGNKRKILDVLIAGDHPITDAFFANIYACSQMLDTKTVIRLASKSAEERMWKYADKWPLLSKSSKLFLNDEPVVQNPKNEILKIDKVVTDENDPFAYVYFYDWDSSENEIDELYSEMQESSEIGWVVLADDIIPKNTEHAEKLAEVMSSNEKKSFIGYLDERGDGYDLRELGEKFAGVTAVPFGCNNKYSLDERDFKKGIREQVLLLHKHYMREWNETANATEIWRNFTGNAYNVNSSLCSVLSIPYKLESIGIDIGEGDNDKKFAARKFYDRVLASREDNPLYNKMIYLEHRRWICFMTTEGYRNPTKDELNNYAFVGKHDQRNKDTLLHALMCKCDISNGMRLHELTHDDWEKSNYPDIAKKSGKPLDELDKASLLLHQICSGRVAKLSIEEGELRDTLSAVENCILSARLANGEEHVKSLKTTCRRMIDNESNINQMWRRFCRELESAVREHERNTGFKIEGFKRDYDKLKGIMKVVIERNEYHDYKRSDKTILEAIPLLLMSSDPIRRIHKPVGTHVWQDVVNALIIEPDELILYSDNQDEIDKELIESFLQKERGLSVKVKYSDMNTLRKLRTTKSSVKSVLDITGISPRDAFELARCENLSKIPTVEFKGGIVDSFGKKSPADYYSVIKRHLTVKETFRLFNSNLHLDNQKNPMLGLSSNYEYIWKAFMECRANPWHVLVGVLHQAEKRCYWRIHRSELFAADTILQIEHIPRSLILDTEIDKVFADLHSRNLIYSDYSFPSSGQIGMVRVRTRYKDVYSYIKKMFELSQKHSYMHKFRFIQTRREALTGQASDDEIFYIYDDTLVVDTDVLHETFEYKKGKETTKERKIDIVKSALEKLLNQTKKGERMVIDTIPGRKDLIVDKKPVDAAISEKTDSKEVNSEADNAKKDNKDKENNKDKKCYFTVQFVYKNRATKECLIKEGNALEVYTYHTIWSKVRVDDVKLNVSFTWDSDNPNDSLAHDAIINEIDLVLTNNMQTYFVSCKQAMMQKDYLQEIKFFADYFGIDGKAIIITSHWSTNSSLSNKNDVKVISNRSEKMEVFYIDRGMIGDTPSDMDRCKLAKYIQNIVDGKKDWNKLS